MEANDPSVSLDLVIRALIALGTSRAELARIMGFDEKPVVHVEKTASIPQSTLPGIVPLTSISEIEAIAR
jgi:hypothetical protein